MERKFKQMELLTERYPVLKPMEEELKAAAGMITDCFAAGNKLLIGGNGGSAADAQHIAGELVKSFMKRRMPPEAFQEKLKKTAGERSEKILSGLQQGLPAISLTGQEALVSAYANDVCWELCFAQQVYGYGKPGDVLLAISTSGNSVNLVYAADVARAVGMKVILLGGKDGGKLKDLSDVALIVPLSETYQIQELHLPIYHALCLEAEEQMFPE